MQDFVGKQIDRYRITERLGMGGMAVVYKAYDTRLERDVALKLIRTESIPQDQHERLLKRFEREAKSQARFSHPNIVSVHDYGEVDGAPYLVMEYIPGGTLKDRIPGPVDWQQAVGWMIPIADALRYAHHHRPPTIHRDIKPGNILFDEEERPILTDFGIAKILETDEATLTGTGMGVGTPEYMAPEQWKGQASPATDQYALGVVLYELLTGQKPYTAETPAAVAILQATEPLRAPSQFVDSIPEGVEKVLYKALARDPQDRYEDMRVLKNALERLLDGEGIQEPEPVTKKQPPIKPEPIPVVDSEGETRDALEPTPVEVEVRRKAEKQTGSKEGSGKKLPPWLPWGLLGILAVVLVLVLAFGRGGGDEPEPAEVAEVEPIPSDEKFPTLTETLEPSPTHTATERPTLSPTKTETPTEAFGVGSTWTNEKDGAEMVYVPAGDFLMGSEDSDADDDEDPEHTVFLDAYWIYKYEVTNAQFAAFLNAQGNQEEGGVTWLDVNDEDARITQSGGAWVADSGYGDHPVVEVSWYGAQAYCEWAGGRLPTEAEWEKAARGEDGLKFPWGDTSVTGSKANYCDTNCTNDWKDSSQDDDYEQTAPVGSFPDGASPYGALDMAGNVWEWVGDWYDEDYYDSSPGSNPTGPSSGDYRVLRGGSWLDIEWYLRASDRRWDYPGNAGNYYFGFRCFRSP